MPKCPPNLDFRTSLINFHEEAEATEPDIMMTLGGFLNANRDGFTPGAVIDMFGSLVATGKHVGDEGSGGRWRIEIFEWKTLELPKENPDGQGTPKREQGSS
jgi:hypothetical protein